MTFVFLLQISDHYVVGNNQEKFKKDHVSFYFLGNHLDLLARDFLRLAAAGGWRLLVFASSSV